MLVVTTRKSITIYKENYLFCVHISKYQFYSLKYNFLKIDRYFYKLFYKIIYICYFFFLFINNYTLIFSDIFHFIFSKYNFILYIIT